MSRPTTVELTNRVARISEILLRGAARAVVLQYVAEKTDWGVSEKTVDNYIKKATDIIKAGSETDTAYEIGKAKERSEFLWQKAISMQDFREARAVQKDRRDLLGLDASKRLELSGPDGGEVPIRLVEVILPAETNNDK